MRKGVGENKKRKKQENKANKENTRFPGGVKTCISEKGGESPEVRIRTLSSCVTLNRVTGVA